ncbi:MAG: DMT family transporter [Pseudomonadota bacterium]
MRLGSKSLIAVLWVLVSTAIFTLIFAAAKIVDGEIGTFQLLVLRYMSSFATVLLLARFSGGVGRYLVSRPYPHLLRAALGSSAAAAITWSTAHMPVADATSIGMLYGVITVVLGIVFLRERVGRAHWLAILISIAGAALIMREQGAFQAEFVGFPALIALLSAILMSAEGMMIRILSQKEPAITLMLYVSGFGLILMLGPALLEWRPMSPLILAGCLLLGPLGILAQYCTIRGYRMAPLSVVGPIDYSWIVFASLLGVFVFGEIPGWFVVAGASLVVTGGVLLTRLRPGAGPGPRSPGSEARR